VLAVAITLGLLGFALSFLWAGALVVMAILWGMMVAERKQRRGSVKGLAAELVTTLADEAKDVMEAASGSGRGAVTSPPAAREGADEA
jgi:hypothetical protein